MSALRRHRTPAIAARLRAGEVVVLRDGWTLLVPPHRHGAQRAVAAHFERQAVNGPVLALHVPAISRLLVFAPDALAAHGHDPAVVHDEIARIKTIGSGEYSPERLLDRIRPDGDGVEVLRFEVRA